MATNKPSFWSTSNALFWGLLCVIFAFGGAISCNQVNSYRADKNNLNTFWIITTVIAILIAIFFFYKAATTAGSGKSDKLD